MSHEMLLRQAALYQEDARLSLSLYGDAKTAKVYAKRAEYYLTQAARKVVVK